MASGYEILEFVPLTKRAHPRYEIGDWTYGLPQVIDYEEGRVKLKIGKFCSIADDVIFLLGGEHRPDMVTTYPFSAFFPFAGSHPHHTKIKGDIVVGNDVWFGRGALILSGVTIGNGAVIGARSVVSREVKPYSIVVGSPARHIRFRFDESLIEELNKICWWDWPMEQIEEALPLLISDNVREFVEKYKTKGAD